jgi:hypothetical protein
VYASGRWRPVERKRSRAGIAPAPRAIKAERDRPSNGDRTVITEVLDSHL